MNDRRKQSKLYSLVNVAIACEIAEAIRLYKHGSIRVAKSMATKYLSKHTDNSHFDSSIEIAKCLVADELSTTKKLIRDVYVNKVLHYARNQTEYAIIMSYSEYAYADLLRKLEE